MMIMAEKWLVRHAATNDRMLRTGWWLELPIEHHHYATESWN
jgi:hypothetical protein